MNQLGDGAVNRCWDASSFANSGYGPVDVINFSQTTVDNQILVHGSMVLTNLKGSRDNELRQFCWVKFHPLGCGYRRKLLGDSRH